MTMKSKEHFDTEQEAIDAMNEVLPRVSTSSVLPAPGDPGKFHVSTSDLANAEAGNDALAMAEKPLFWEADPLY